MPSYRCCQTEGLRPGSPIFPLHTAPLKILVSSLGDYNTPQKLDQKIVVNKIE